MNDLDKLITINCGLHSGFPKCCIDYYIHFWLADEKEKARHRATIINLKVGYVPCPQCVDVQNFVKVKSCSCVPNYIGRAMEPDEIVEKSYSATYDENRVKKSGGWTMKIINKETGAVKEEVVIAHIK